MNTRFRKLLVAGFLLLGLLPAGLAQEKAKEKEPQNTQERLRMTGKVFEIKHRDPNELRSLLDPLGSGIPGSTMRANEEFRTLSVRDFPENLAAIEAAIKRLDTPANPASDVQLTMQVLLASNQERPKQVFPGGLEDVVTQLASTLNYKWYYLLASNVQRIRLGGDAHGTGSVRSEGQGFSQPLISGYNYGIARFTPIADIQNEKAYEVRAFRFTLEQHTESGMVGKVELQTNLQIREGEKVVVGTSNLGQDALIVVLTATAVK